jgi:hypothetical protein
MRDRERGWERRERKMLKSKGKSEEKKTNIYLSLLFLATPPPSFVVMQIFSRTGPWA